MKSNLFFALVFIPLIFISCKGDEKLSDTELIEKNVRNFFFMGDTVDVEVTVTDTIFADDLNEMLTTVEENIRLIQLDIDTLQIMIDDWSYKSLELEKTDSIKAKDIKIKSLDFRLKLNQLEFQKAQFAQTNRILLHLKRSIWANIAGFEATVHYELGEEINDLEILMDANYTVVD